MRAVVSNSVRIPRPSGDDCVCVCVYSIERYEIPFFAELPIRSTQNWLGQFG